MSLNQIIATLTEIHELKRMQEELACEIETLQGKIKAHMDETGVETLIAGAWRVSYKAVTSSRLDATALREALPDIAQRFTRTSTIRRLCVR